MRTLSRSQQQVNQLASLMKNAAGRAKFANAVGPSLRRRRDYQSIIRKGFMVEVLPAGAIPAYDKEFDETGRSFVEAFVVPEEGMTPQKFVKPKRVVVPTFEISAQPMISITTIQERRFDVVERSLNLGKAEVGATEDGYGFSIFDEIAAEAATGDANVYNKDLAITGAGSKIIKDTMADAFAGVERHDLPAALVLTNPQDYVDFRKWGANEIDRETQRQLLKTGVMGYLWGAMILQSRKVKVGVLYVLTDAEFLGVIPERIPMTVMSADNPGMRQIGFSIFENIGFLCHNPSGVQRVTISRV